MRIPIEISARHIHLSQNDADILFGKGCKFNIFKALSQRGQYAYEEMVKLVGPRGEIENVRFAGPCRPRTQVEISETDARKLGIDVPVRESGKLAGTPGLKVIGPKDEVNLKEGVIVALRHVHMDPKTAAKLGVKNGDIVKVDINGIRDLIFENVVVRVDPSFRLSMHIDTDEANAAQIDEENHFGKLIIN
ncbi:phosphate propanoyltransferase [Candidatus Falkowbacteria bacterium]|nr:phosphate propanoyltransferase [Candidatus Falkowbacteria bacterium]